MTKGRSLNGGSNALWYDDLNTNRLITKFLSFNLNGHLSNSKMSRTPNDRFFTPYDQNDTYQTTKRLSTKYPYTKWPEIQ